MTRLGAELSLEVLNEVAVGADELDVSTVVDDLLLGLEDLVVGAVDGGESPLLGDDDLLASGELEGEATNSSQQGRGDGSSQLDWGDPPCSERGEEPP
jgi:hypothetical protein